MKNEFVEYITMKKMIASGNCLMSTISHILCNAVAIAATLLFF